MNRIRELRLEKKISMKEAARQLNMPYTTYVNYEKGTREPNSETLIEIANYYNTSIDYMLGKSDTRIDEKTLGIVNEIDTGLLAQAGNIRDALILQAKRDSEIPPGFQPLPETYKAPIVGRIACGQPITAEENIEGYADVPVGKRVDFCLLCEGDSMIDAGIDDGDVVYIRKQPDIENGEIAAVRIENEATLKRVYKYPDRLVLQPENRSYPPMTYVGEEMNQVSIEGKAVGWTHWV